MSPLVSSCLYLLLITCVLAAPVFETISQSDDETDPSLNYKFGFQVRDAHNHNFQERHETRDKGVISGYYSLLEPDGSLRVVTYTADHDGFRALVARQGSSTGQAISATAHS